MGEYQKILNNFSFDYFIDGYILNDLQIVVRCARSAALIRASARVRVWFHIMVTSNEISLMVTY